MMFRSGEVTISIYFTSEKDNYSYYDYICVINDKNIMKGDFQCRAGYTVKEVAWQIVEWKTREKGLQDSLETNEEGIILREINW